MCFRHVQGITVLTVHLKLTSLLAFFAAVLAPGQLGVHQEPQILFCKAAFWTVDFQHVLVAGVIPQQVQDFALLIVELYEVPVSPFLQAVNTEIFTASLGLSSYPNKAYPK